jgi:hypothetical protein
MPLKDNSILNYLQGHNITKEQNMAKDVDEPDMPIPATSMPVPDKPAPQVQMDAKFKAPNKMSLDDIKDTAKRMLGQYPARGSK